MRAVVCTPNGPALQTDRPIPRPSGLNEVRLKVRCAGICDTDLQLLRGYMGFQGVLGHEFVAEDPSGRRVTAEINHSCRQCDICHGDETLTGQIHARHCPNRSVMGILNQDGAMADFVIADTRNVHAIPDSLDDREAVFIEPLAAALHAANQAKALRLETCAVLGDGKLGILCAWAFRHAGFATTLVGKHPEKLALVGPNLPSCLVAEVESKRHCFALVVDATGSASGLPLALQLVRPCGAIVLKTTIAARHELDLAPLVVNEIHLIGSRCGPFPPAIAALQSKTFDVTRLIEAEFPLDNALEALGAAARPGARKILLRP